MGMDISMPPEKFQSGNPNRSRAVGDDSTVSVGECGGMDISIPIRQVIPVEAAKGIPSKRKRESSSSVRRTNWSGEHWWDRWDFNTPAHHQIMEKVIEDEVHVALAKAGLVASPIMTIPYWLIDSARYLLPEEEYTAQ